MSHANSPSVTSEDEAQPASLPAIPKAALKALETVPGGSWTVTGQTKDTYSLKYRTKGGRNDVSFTMHPCTTEKDIRAQCGQFFYDINAQPELSTAPINPNRHAIDNLLLEGKKHKRPLNQGTQPGQNGNSGQPSNAAAPVPVSMAHAPGSTTVNHFAQRQVPVSPATSFPMLPSPPYATHSGNGMGFSLLDHYNHPAATPSGADRWDRAVSDNLVAINHVLGARERMDLALHQQQSMPLQQQSMSPQHQPNTAFHPQQQNMIFAQPQTLGLPQQQAVALQQQTLNFDQQMQLDHQPMSLDSPGFMESHSNDQDPMSTEFEDAFHASMTMDDSWTHINGNAPWDNFFSSP